MTKKYREIQSSGPKSTTGQARRALYARSLTRVKEAREAGFVLEAITLLESMITDRLEARLAHKNGQKIEKRKFSTLVKLAEELKGENSNDPSEAKAIYERVIAWADSRNQAIHEFAKLEEEGTKDWETKYREAEVTAKAGVKLFRDLSEAVRKLNEPKKEKP